MLNIGDKAPDFALPSDSDDTLSLSDMDHEFIVLYFYPKDNTPGCTTEALDFTAMIEDFAALDAKVIGVSKDSIRKHKNFITKHDLKVTLLSDVTGEMIESYGVWVEKKMYGKTYMGIERSTFLISKSGEIIDIWRKVRVKGHAETVHNRLKEHVTA